MAQISVSSEHADSATGAHVAPLALTGLAVTTFFLGASQAGLFTATAIIGLVLFFGGIVQLIVGLWDHRAGNAVHAHAFATHGAFWMAYGATVYLPRLASGHELGYFFLAWTVVAGIVSLTTLRANFAHVVTFLLFFLTFLGLTIGAFMGAGSFFTTLGGWIGIVTAIVAGYTALASLGSPFALPTGERS